MRGVRGAKHPAFRHGGTGTPEFEAYRNAKKRCTNPKNCEWRNYGGRGIKFLFTSFEQFLAEIGPRPAGRSLARIDGDSHYMLGNVRWATAYEQTHSRRVHRAVEGFSTEALLTELRRRIRQ